MYELKAVPFKLTYYSAWCTRGPGFRRRDGRAAIPALPLDPSLDLVRGLGSFSECVSRVAELGEILCSELPILGRLF